jgi:hypothetical protein
VGARVMANLAAMPAPQAWYRRGKECTACEPKYCRKIQLLGRPRLDPAQHQVGEISYNINQ